MKKVLLSLLPMLFIAFGIFAQPTEIYTAEDLHNIRNNTNGDGNIIGDYILMNDIDLDHTTLSSEPWYDATAGWEPFEKFQGTFDGAGFEIQNMYINRPTENNVGLFGWLGIVGTFFTEDGVIHDLGVTDADVTGAYKTGILCGHSYGYIYDCFTTGSVTSHGGGSGGFIGRQSLGHIYDCYTSATVIGVDVSHMGGFAGTVDGGTSSSDPGVERCFATGNVSGAQFIGGFTGSTNDGFILDSYSMGDVLATGDASFPFYGACAGGFIGILSNWDFGFAFSNCYSTGNVDGSGLTFTGPFVGADEMEWGSYDPYSYYNSETAGAADNGIGTPRTTDEMTHPYASNTYESWDFTTPVWVEDAAYDNQGYPYFDWQTFGPAGPVYNVTQGNYYALIQDAIDAANANDIIEVYAITVEPNVYVDIDLTIDLTNIPGPVVTDEKNYTLTSGVSATLIGDASLTFDGMQIILSGENTLNVNNLNIGQEGNATSNKSCMIANGILNELILSGVNNFDGRGSGFVYGGTTYYIGGGPGIEVEANRYTASDELTISGNGTLNAVGASWDAGIGGKGYRYAGKVIINGGTINATGGMMAAGIGGGQDSGREDENEDVWRPEPSPQIITINGGLVTAQGGSTAAGIGTGGDCYTDSNGGEITINDGTVNATGGSHGAGIGCGQSNAYEDPGTGGIITILNGTVTATSGGDNAAGIGGGGPYPTGGPGGNCGEVCIDPAATVVAVGGANVDDIGPGLGGDPCLFCNSSSMETYIQEPVTTTCDEFDIEITVQDFIDVGAISLKLFYDDAVFSYTGATVNPAFTGSSTFGGSGVFVMSYFSGTGTTLADDDVLVTLHMDLIDFTGGTTVLEWSDTPGDCEYAGPGGTPVYTSTFNDLTWDVPAALSLSETHVDVDCFGDTDGSIDLTVTGGTPDFTYVWTGPDGFSATTEDISGLAPGLYSVDVTDANGCVDSFFDISIDVLDNTPPTIVTCPPDYALEGCSTSAITGLIYSEDEVVVDYSDFSGAGGDAFDDCAITYVSYQDASTGPCPIVVTRTWTLSDGMDNTITCTQTITINAPLVSLTCPGDQTVAACQTQAAIDAAFATWLGGASFSGGCNASISNDNTGAPSACGGSTTVTWTVTSDCEGDVTCSATFTVTDAPAVTLTCPGDQTEAACQDQAAIDAAFATWLGGVSFSGGCNASISDDNTGAPLACGGSTTVTWTVTSDCEADVTCSATFTVTADNEAPVITCPDDVTVHVNSGCEFVGSIGDATATDNCTADGDIAITSDAPASFDYDDSPVTVTWTATDLCGNSSSCTQTVTVVKNSIAGTLMYNNTAQTPLGGVEITLNPGGATVTTGVNGDFAFTDLCYDTYTLSIEDVDDVCYINSTDAAQAAAWFAGPVPIEHVRFLAGDVDLDGGPTVNPTDAQNIQQYFVFGTPLPRVTINGFDYVFWRAGDLILNNSDPNRSQLTYEIECDDDLTVDVYGQAVGDFNGSHTPGSSRSASTSVELQHPGTIMAAAGTEIALPISMVNASHVGAVSLILTFPEDLAKVNAVTMPENEGNLSWSADGNRLTIGWNSLQTMWMGSGEELLTVWLQVSEEFSQGDAIQVDLAGSPLNELADGNYSVIPDAILEMDRVEFSTYGIFEPSAGGALTLEPRPNPFRDFTMLTYNVPVEGHVTLKVSDMYGREIAMLVDHHHVSGKYTIKMDALPLEPGIYTATLILGAQKGDLIKSVRLIRTR